MNDRPQLAAVLGAALGVCLPLTLFSVYRAYFAVLWKEASRHTPSGLEIFPLIGFAASAGFVLFLGPLAALFAAFVARMATRWGLRLRERRPWSRRGAILLSTCWPALAVVLAAPWTSDPSFARFATICFAHVAVSAFLPALFFVEIGRRDRNGHNSVALGA